jgi:hypothetical protein
VPSAPGFAYAKPFWLFGAGEGRRPVTIRAYNKTRQTTKGHILPALKMLRIFLFGPTKRHIQPERYTQCALKLVGNLLNKKNVDKR